MISLAQAIARYGAVTNGIWPDESKWCSLVEIPADIASHIINSATGKPTTHIYCNKDMGPSLLLALSAVKAANLLNELQTFDGCLMVRMQRGSTDMPSTHCYALAIDLNAKINPLGGVSQWSAAFVKCFTDVGFIWGGTFARKDPMHFQQALF